MKRGDSTYWARMGGVVFTLRTTGRPWYMPCLVYHYTNLWVFIGCGIALACVYGQRHTAGMELEAERVRLEKALEQERQGQ